MKISDSKEKEKGIQKRHDNLLQAMVKNCGNINKQLDRERLQNERLATLQKEIREINNKRSELEVERATLSNKNTVIKNSLDSARYELANISSELKGTYRVNCRFILDQFATKVANVTINRSTMSEYFWREAVVNMVEAVPLSAKILPKPESYFSKEPQEYRTGKEFILSEFNSQIFMLLLEIQRIKLQDEIRLFIKKNYSVFSDSIYMNWDILRKRLKLFDKKAKNKISQKEKQNILEDYKEEIARVKKTQKALLEAIETMKGELSADI